MDVARALGLVFRPTLRLRATRSRGDPFLPAPHNRCAPGSPAGCMAVASSSNLGSQGRISARNLSTPDGSHASLTLFAAPTARCHAARGCPYGYTRYACPTGAFVPMSTSHSDPKGSEIRAKARTKSVWLGQSRFCSPRRALRRHIPSIGQMTSPQDGAQKTVQ